MKAPSECPVCGAAVPRAARACPACGADERTGWNEEATRYDGLDLPENAFEREGSASRRVDRNYLTKTGVPYFTWIVAVALIGMVATLVFYRFM